MAAPPQLCFCCVEGSLKQVLSGMQIASDGDEQKSVQVWSVVEAVPLGFSSHLQCQTGFMDASGEDGKDLVI